MNLELGVFEYYCATRLFVINGVGANKLDFGEQGDSRPEEAAPYCCANMQFTRIPATAEVLEKYGITLAEYSIVAGQLEVLLSFGACCLCE